MAFRAGEKNPRSTCTDREITLALELLVGGMPVREVAKKFEVSRSTIWRWRHSYTRSIFRGGR